MRSLAAWAMIFIGYTGDFSPARPAAKAVFGQGALPGRRPAIIYSRGAAAFHGRWSCRVGRHSQEGWPHID